MTPEHKLATAAILATIILALATLLAPALSVYVKFRLSQPKPKPMSTEKDWAKRWGYWLGSRFRGIVQITCAGTLCVLGLAIYYYPSAPRFATILISVLLNLLSLQVVFYFAAFIYALASNWILKNVVLVKELDIWFPDQFQPHE